MKLLSNTKFGLLHVATTPKEEFAELRNRYDLFLSRELQLGMFVPCKLVDGVWVVLEEPKENDLCSSFFDMQTGFNEEKEYQEAKGSVLFKGFTFKPAISEEYFDILKYNNGNVLYPKLWKNETIEFLIKYNLELTPTAIKHIYGEERMH